MEIFVAKKNRGQKYPGGPQLVSEGPAKRENLRTSHKFSKTRRASHTQTPDLRHLGKLNTDRKTVRTLQFLMFSFSLN